jgi:hypothetical protein
MTPSQMGSWLTGVSFMKDNSINEGGALETYLLTSQVPHLLILSHCGLNKLAGSTNIQNIP